MQITNDELRRMTNQEGLILLFHDGLLRLIIHAILISRHGIGTVLNEEEVEC